MNINILPYPLHSIAEDEEFVFLLNLTKYNNWLLIKQSKMMC